MSERIIKLKEPGAEPCPHCGNKVEFKIVSMQVAEDCCEIWAECKCGYKPAFDGIEDVWGGCDDDNCINAINITWNDELK
jgi:hypothetical protein